MVKESGGGKRKGDQLVEDKEEQVLRAEASGERRLQDIQFRVTRVSSQGVYPNHQKGETGGQGGSHGGEEEVVQVAHTEVHVFVAPELFSEEIPAQSEATSGILEGEVLITPEWTAQTEEGGYQVIRKESRAVDESRARTVSVLTIKAGEQQENRGERTTNRRLLP